MLSVPLFAKWIRQLLPGLLFSTLPILATPPSSSSARPSAARPSPVPDPDTTSLEAAYRADLADMDHPMFLGLDEAQILCDHLEMGVEIYRVDGNGPASVHGPAITNCAILNADALEDDNQYILLFHQRHFSVLAPREEAEISQYAEWLGDFPEQYVEVGEELEQGYRGIPADGNCLITALYFVANERFPNRRNVAKLRARVAARLTPEQIRHGIQEMIDDLITNAAERPWEAGRFAGWGPRTSAQLATIPEFMAARERVIEPLRQAQKAMEAAAAQREAEEEPLELEAAIALSLQGGMLDDGETAPNSPA